MANYLFVLYVILWANIDIFGQQSDWDKMRMEKMIIRDTIFLKEYLDDSLLYIHSNGLIESKQDFIYSVMSQKIVYKKAEFLSRKIQSNCMNHIIYNGIVIVSGLYDKQVFQVKLAFTSMYRKVRKKYRLYYWQSTKLKE